MKWTAEKISMLRAEYACADLRTLADRLEVSIRALKSKAGKLSLRRGRQHHHWTAEELDMLGLLYPDNSNRGIAETLGVSASCIENKAHSLGLRKSEKYLSRMQTLRSQHPSVRASQFKTGHGPFNKGIAQSRWMQRDGGEKNNAVRTRFKPGHVPSNTLPLGTESLRADGFVYIKTSGGWRQKHILVWQRLHGAVPEGKRIVFRDGDKRNFSADNLMAVTPSEAAAIRLRRLPPEKRALMLQRARAARNKAIERDKRRIRWGLDPVSKLVKNYYPYQQG